MLLVSESPVTGHAFRESSDNPNNRSSVVATFVISFRSEVICPRYIPYSIGLLIRNWNFGRG